MASETTKKEIMLPVNVAGTIQETKVHVIEGDMGDPAGEHHPSIEFGPEVQADKEKEKAIVQDGASNVKWSGLEIILKPPKGNTIRQSIETSKLTNNEAEYEAMIVGLKLAKSLGAEIIKAKCDSQLMVNQVNKTFEVREDRMQMYLDKLQVTLHWFKEWTLQHVPREQNGEADALANLGSLVEDDEISSGTVVQLSKSVVEEGHAEINSTSLTWDWRNKYIDYLKNGKLPSDSKESRTLRTKVAQFTLAEDGTLYRRMFDGPLEICLGPGDTDYVL
ncbi:uncharacterized protein [Nicotiana sylvestris]|uniref:uncharacterized protein n=1 Tax=Nicotiana sylvestris TaxID=4096 RepID=UPI00388C9DFA